MTLGKVKDVLVPIQAVLGETDLSVEDLSNLQIGSIVELRNLAGEPINVVASGRIIAKAEVVVIDEAFGVRITEVIENGE